MHLTLGLACRVGHCLQAHLQGDFFSVSLRLMASVVLPLSPRHPHPHFLHFCSPGAGITLKHPVLRSAQDCFQGCWPTFWGVRKMVCHTGGEGLLGTRTDGTLTVVGQLLTDRGRPQSPPSLVTTVGLHLSTKQMDSRKRSRGGAWALAP